MIRAYTARQMTGLLWADIVTQAAEDVALLSDYGIHALDPVLAEVEQLGSIPPGRVGDEKVDLTHHWRRDKRMIRHAHVLIDLSPEAKSEGIAHEIGYARYFLWRPIVRVFRKGPAPSVSIAFFEDDVICESLEDAAELIHLFWGTWWRRARWRTKMYARSRLKALWYELASWK